MANPTTKVTLNQALIKELRALQGKRESLIASNLHVPEHQSVMIPIPNVLVTDGDKEVLKFIKNIGLIRADKSFGLDVAIEAGEKVTLTDGRSSTILECIFYYTGDTKIDEIEQFLEQN